MKLKWSVLLILLSVAVISRNSVPPTATAAGFFQEPTFLQPKATLTVSNANDSGPGSLRQALLDAQPAGTDQITFNIPLNLATSGAFFINLTAPLPPVPAGTFIDGDSQARNVSNSNLNGPEIFINAGTSTIGLQVNEASCTIRSLGVFGASTAGIQISGAGATNTVIEGCFVGTNQDGSGVASKPNGVGISIFGGAAGNRIGGDGSAARNIVSGNTSAGISIQGTGTNNNVVRNNVIGLNQAQTSGIPNGSTGITIQGGASSNLIGGAGTESGNLIGRNNGSAGVLISGTGTNSNTIQGNVIGTNAQRASLGNLGDGVRIVSGASSTLVGGQSVGNVIAFNGGGGVRIGNDNSDFQTLRNTVSRNSIFGNAGLGIDLGATGANQNDSGDFDTGPNALLNKPLITNVARNGSTVTVTGRIDAFDATSITVEFLANFTSPANQQFVTNLTGAFGGNEFTANFTAPSGTFTVTATATDSLGNTSEFSDPASINTQPDLTVQNLVVTPTTVAAGGTVSASFSVRNIGATSANVTTSAAVVLSTDNRIDSADQILTRVSVPAIQSNGTTDLTASSVTIPASTASGPRFIGVLADIDGTVSEGNETNNSASVPVTVLLPRPDLAINSVTLSTTTAPLGGAVTVNVNLVNRGSAAANASVLQLALSSDSIITSSDTPLGTVNAGAVGPGGSIPLSATVNLPTTIAPGSYFVGATADSNLAVDETDETNNTASTPLTVVGNADLVVDSLTVNPASVPPGSTITVTFAIRNQGNFMAGSTINDLVLSTDNVVGNSDDVLLGSRATSALPVGGSEPASVMVTVPTNARVGNVFIGVLADSGKFVTESNETNNTRTTGLIIADQAPPTASIVKPSGGEALASGRSFTIEWTASDNIGVASQELRLSTDGGGNFPNTIAVGLGSDARTFQWTVPAGTDTTTARVQLLVKDAAGNMATATSNGNFTIAAPPVIQTPPKLGASGKLTLSGINILPGAKLRVTVGSQTEVFDLFIKSGKILVKQTARSSPSGRVLKDVLPKGVTASFVVVNPNGIASDPVTAGF